MDDGHCTGNGTFVTASKALIIMSTHIIIDGYNFIRRSSYLSEMDLIDIQLGRETLIEMLAGYRKLRPHRITVVFDGANAPSYSQRNDKQYGIGIIFSRVGESADAVIKRMASKEREKALIVTSDRDIMNSVLNSGGSVIGSKEFEKKLSLVYDTGYTEKDNQEGYGWKPTTKKKGPSKRLPRRARRNKRKIDKL